MNTSVTDTPKSHKGLLPALAFTLCAILLTIYSFTYLQPFFSTEEQFDSVEEVLVELNRQNRLINLELLEIESDPTADFGKIPGYIKYLETLEMWLHRALDSHHINPAIATKMDQYISGLEKKQQLITEYQVSVAAYHKAEKDLPISKRELLQEARENNIKHMEQFRLILDGIYTQIHAFLEFPDAARKERTLRMIDVSSTKLQKIAVGLEAPIEYFLANAHQLIDQKIKRRDYIEGLLSDDTHYTEIDVLSAYIIDNNANAHRWDSLFILSGLMLLFIITALLFWQAHRVPKVIQ